MSTSSRFAVAVHILTTIATHDNIPVTSELIASSVNSHPTVIRRLLSMLSAAGFTRTRFGQGGGALLARPATEITLLDVFDAVEDGKMFATHRSEPNRNCPIGSHILPVLSATFDQAEQALRRELQSVTIADIATKVLAAVKADEKNQTLC